MRTMPAMLPLALTAAAAIAQPGTRPDRDDHAAPAESRQVLAELAKIGCRPNKPIEKENGLYEADDVPCRGIGQFDIKLDGRFRIQSMTRDD